MQLKAEVAVIGAGVIGLSAAFRLAEEGYDVLSIDAKTQPVGASEGNAGTVAPYNCVPIGSPTVIRSLPHLLFHRDSPFAMPWSALPAVTPWLVQFVLEPALTDVQGPAVFFPDTAHVSNPSQMLGQLRAAAAARGVRSKSARVEQICPSPSEARLIGPGFTVNAHYVVIAAGAWSRPLARQAGDDVPLDTERGYHLEYGVETPPLSRPVCAARFGIYLTSMRGRLRAAGTVEFGGLQRCANSHRLAYVDRAVRSLPHGLPAPRLEWIGFRPSMPDSLPVIGRARDSSRIVYAFGHGHLGLMLAAVTARQVASLLSGTGRVENSAACLPTRPLEKHHQIARHGKRHVPAEIRGRRLDARAARNQQCVERRSRRRQRVRRQPEPG